MSSPNHSRTEVRQTGMTSDSAEFNEAVRRWQVLTGFVNIARAQATSRTHNLLSAQVACPERADDAEPAASSKADD